jgi:hypothetical protein
MTVTVLQPLTGKVDPFRIHAVNEIILFFPGPGLQLLFPADGVPDVVVLFKVDKGMKMISFGESVNGTG